MKKLIPVLLLILISGCATAPRQQGTIPPEIHARVSVMLPVINKCISPTEQTETVVYQDQAPNAMYSDGKVYLSEGLFKFDDHVLRFVIAHEIAHQRLGHIKKVRAMSWGVTGAMMVVGYLVPGAGLLNYAVNPAITNNFTKTQEHDADLAAYHACRCMGMSKEEIIRVIRTLQASTADAGGFWDKHPSWDERIKHIESAH